MFHTNEFVLNNFDQMLVEYLDMESLMYRTSCKITLFKSMWFDSNPKVYDFVDIKLYPL